MSWFSHFSKRLGKTMSQTATIKHSGHLSLLCTCPPHCCDTEPTKEMLVDSSLVRWSIRTRCCTMSVLTQWPGLLSLMKCQSLLEELLRWLRQWLTVTEETIVIHVYVCQSRDTSQQCHQNLILTLNFGATSIHYGSIWLFCKILCKKGHF